ncbi:hypothetical protein K2Z83_25825 [Oscillochloris sp. ZM17-4]|uniref:hypothetical protein n=1 Tax=Oscillochloris sp. ZM17-4 TaxID=2866714 RepID=UPI001C72A364|nr:hypothetical protein [Oscillochloris sp. ZM17-4]MBX0331075.1 hypothetical protein [Oscillochloris sp. ZM17-4]
MTTQQPFPKNKVILYGKIDQQRQSMSERKKNATPLPAVRSFRNANKGTDYTVDVQVAAPYGGSYQIDIDVGMVEGADILAGAQAGQMIVLEGHLTRTREVDRRFRDYDAEMIEGIIYQDVVIQVERVRPRQESDPATTGSNIWVEGVVVEPPVFFRHPDFPEIELARVGVKARTTPALSDDGVVRPGRPCEVTVIVPTDDEGAELLYRRGNQVRVRGVLERVAMRQNRDLVRERVTELQDAWNQRRAEIKAQAEGAERALLTEGDRYLREKERTERSARTMVLAVAVTPLDGATPISRAEAIDDRDAYTREWRAAREQRRREQRERRRGNLAHEAAARAADGEQPGDPPARVVSRRPRRSLVETEAVIPVVDVVAEALPEAEVPAPRTAEDVPVLAEV